MGRIKALVSDYKRGNMRLSAEMTIRFAKAMGVSADELLGLEKQTKTAGSITNRRLLKKAREIEKLPRRDQEALLRTIEAFLAKAG